MDFVIVLLIIAELSIVPPLVALSIVGIVMSRKPITKALSIIACVMVSVMFVCGVVVIEKFEASEQAVDDDEKETDAEVTEDGLSFLDDFTQYGYSAKQISAMRTVLTNVGITEITELEITPVSAGMQTVKGLAYKDTSFLADANDEVQVTFNIENGVIYLITVYCPSYHTANKPTYLSGLTNRRADLYYDVEGGYLKKIDWEKKAVVDYN